LKRATTNQGQPGFIDLLFKQPGQPAVGQFLFPSLAKIRVTHITMLLIADFSSDIFIISNH
jgi:hypothetical protein